MIFMTIYSLLATAFFIYNLRCHMKAKGFFWTELPVSKKEVINYIVGTITHKTHNFV